MLEAIGYIIAIIFFFSVAIISKAQKIKSEQQKIKIVTVISHGEVIGEIVGHKVKIRKNKRTKEYKISADEKIFTYQSDDITFQTREEYINED